MIVWGGGASGLNTGGRYDPALNTWTPTSTGANVPTARYSHSAVWTGSEMIIWGGFSLTLNELNTGGRYNPVSDTWTATSVAGVPSARFDHVAVWTGTEMIVSKGQSQSTVNAGGRYNPSTNSWQSIASDPNNPAEMYRNDRNMDRTIYGDLGRQGWKQCIKLRWTLQSLFQQLASNFTHECS